VRVSLTFTHLAIANLARCEEAFHPIDEWSETDWACAFGGEAGEAQNKIKKRRRGYRDTNNNLVPTVEEVVDEIADAVIYADLLCTRMGASLEDGIRRKFNEVSERVHSGHRL
jgi:NTP pyrophosphatase (non-canonical NTP hydrolase)